MNTFRHNQSPQQILSVHPHGICLVLTTALTLLSYIFFHPSTWFLNFLWNPLNLQIIEPLKNKRTPIQLSLILNPKQINKENWGPSLHKTMAYKATKAFTKTNSTYLLKSSNLHISSQALAGSHLHGLAWGLSRPTPPVRRNFHSSSSISFLPLSRFTHSSKENSN